VELTENRCPIITLALRWQHMILKTEWTIAVGQLESRPMLKSNPVGTFLGCVFLVLAVVTAVLVLVYVQALRSYLSAQGQVAVATQNQAALQNLVTESLAQRERMPEIVPLLQSLGARPAEAPTPLPAGTSTR
jgi:hypothetical protein